MGRPKKAPTVGFVSLGCPKATSDSEQILTRLRAEGYAIGADYRGSDLVVVNTCGFIDAAVAESLDAIGEALAEVAKLGPPVEEPTHEGGRLRLPAVLVQVVQC